MTNHTPLVHTSADSDYLKQFSTHGLLSPQLEKLMSVYQWWPTRRSQLHQGSR